MKRNFVNKVVADFPEYNFVVGKKFAFRPPKTIIIGPSEPQDNLLLLHEVSHAILGHRDFNTDVERVKMEVSAWCKTRDLAKIYGINYDDEMAQNELDTYRDWLHKKSRCPKCGLTRFETSDKKYHCPRCENFA